MQVMQCDLKCKLCIVILNASYAVWSFFKMFFMQITPYKALKSTLKCKLCSVILNASYAVWS